MGTMKKQETIMWSICWWLINHDIGSKNRRVRAEVQTKTEPY